MTDPHRFPNQQPVITIIPKDQSPRFVNQQLNQLSP